MPGSGITVRGIGLDGHPLVWLAPRHGRLHHRAARRGHAAASNRDTVLALHNARRDIMLDELRRERSQAGVTVAISTPHRFSVRHGIAHKEMGTRSSRIAPTS